MELHIVQLLCWLRPTISANPTNFCFVLCNSYTNTGNKLTYCFTKRKCSEYTPYVLVCCTQSTRYIYNAVKFQFKRQTMAKKVKKRHSSSLLLGDHLFYAIFVCQKLIHPTPGWQKKREEKADVLLLVRQLMHEIKFMRRHGTMPSWPKLKESLV